MKTILVLALLTTSSAFAAGPGPAATAAKRQQNRLNQVEKREARQERRIEQGVKKGALTPPELAKLNGLETNIAAMEKTFEGDGKITKQEGRQLNQALNEASLQIWAEKHDTEGVQLSVQRLGKDIIADPEITARIESGSLTRAEAKTFLHEFAELVHIKHRLASDDLTPAQRTTLQERYTVLLSKYFQQKP